LLGELPSKYTLQWGGFSGYFDNPEKLARSAAELSGMAQGAHVTLNPVNPVLLARASNRVQPYAKATTNDGDVARRHRLLFDLDYERPAGISATNEEHAAALERARHGRDWLAHHGIRPDSQLLADSGNGGHVLVAIDLPNDDEATRLVNRCLQAAALYLDDNRVHVDQTTGNAARISKVYGTLAAKGDNVPERPHRLARILEAPAGPMLPVPRETLEAIAALVPDEPKPANRSGRHGPSAFDLQAFISRHGLDVAREGPWNGGTRCVLRVCPFNPEHANLSAVIIQHASGAVSFTCHHNGCSGRDWQELQATLEPAGVVAPARAATKPPAVELIRMRDVQPKDVAWLWHPYIPRAKLTVLAGPPGVGKSALALAVASAMSVGGRLPGLDPVSLGRTLLCTAEDDLADTVRPRLDAMGANVETITAVGALQSGEDQRTLTLTADGVTALDHAIGADRSELVIVDTITAYIGTGVDMNRANEVREILRGLKDLAERHGCAIVVLIHLNKRGTGRAIYQVLGSVDFTAAVRSVLMVDEDSGDRRRSIMMHAKVNVAERGPSQRFQWDGKQFEWLGESATTADEVFNRSHGQPSAIAEAGNFLTELFGDETELPALDVYQAAEAEGLARTTLRRAYEALGGQPRSLHEPGKRGVAAWVWPAVVKSSDEPDDGRGDLGDLARVSGHLNSADDEEWRLDARNEPYLDDQRRKVGHLNNSVAPKPGEARREYSARGGNGRSDVLRALLRVRRLRLSSQCGGDPCLLSMPPAAGDIRGGDMTVTVYDADRRRRRPLSVHAGLDRATARELAAVYRALGYPPECITVESDAAEEAA
jgi:Mrp family chromosome partitioning ATPase